MARYLPGPTPAPGADDVANAIVAAMRERGEGRWIGWLAGLKTKPIGRLPAFLIALAALRRVWPGCLPRLARFWCDGAAPSVALTQARREPWWDEVIVMRIAHDLRDAHQPSTRRFRKRGMR